MVNTLLKYLSHPLLDIKKLTYQSVVSHLKVMLNNKGRLDDFIKINQENLEFPKLLAISA